MSTVHSFPPVARADATTLILGSMPGKASLVENQYYAHPHNLFWPIVHQVFGVALADSYEKRLDLLQSNGIALWDVIKECYRSSSLDGDIVETSIVPNDFAMFFAGHRQIRHVFFNGAKAEQAFKRYVLSGLAHLCDEQWVEMQWTKLPSTSPANASIPLGKKLESWQQIRRVSF